MIKLLNRYQSFIIVLLCFFSMGSAMAANVDINSENDATSELYLENTSLYFPQVQISHHERRDSNPEPSEVIEYEKSNEEESKLQHETLHFTPATIFARSTNKTPNSAQELEKVRWCPTPFAWNLHASRSVFFQVFRI